MSDEKKVEETKVEETKVEETKVEKVEEVKAESKEVEIPAKFKSFVEEIEKMSVLDLAELVKILEEKFGVSAAAPVAMAVAAGGDAGGAEEKDSFDIELTEAGSNKIGAIKAVRELTQQGLKECKDLVESAPVVIKEGVKKEEAEEIKAKLEEAGAKITLK